MSDLNQNLLGNIFSTLFRKIIVPKEFHNQVDSIHTMLEDDLSGLIDSLTDFSIHSATVDFSIETDNEKFTEIIKKWLDTINVEYHGKIPSGIKALSEEYFKERWKSSSFPILKLSGWKPINGILLPTKMYFVDGGSVYAEDKNSDNSNLQLLNYDYYLGKPVRDKKNKLDKNVIFTRPYGRWFDKYPKPYLIKRGIYHNYKIIEALKNKQTTILEQVIPYMMLLRTGTEALSREGIEHTPTEYKAMIKQMQDLMDKLNSNTQIKVPVDADAFHKKIEHLIPDLSTIFNGGLFAVAERNILSGLGFIDVVEATSTSRRESILNPKAFFEETKKGIADFKQLLKEIVILIIEKNKSEHKKYINANTNFRIISSPITAFMTIEFKNQMRLLWERGQLSNRTYCEIVGEVDYEVEKARREKELKNGTEILMYPHHTQNVEKDESFEEIKHQEKFYKKDDKNGDPIPTDKTDDEQKYNIGKTELVIAPYDKVTDLPPAVKKLSLKKQRTFMKTFNSAYYYKLGKTQNKKIAETYAFRAAWSSIKTASKKPLKKSNINLGNEIEYALKTEKLENEKNKSLLIKKLLKKSEEK